MATQSLIEHLVAGAGKVVTWFSFEGLLTSTRRPNGGEIVFLRALLIALLVYLFSIAVQHTLRPARTGWQELQILQGELAANLPVLGAIFAAVYFALYARFASQWTYLSNLYNKIKETEARTSDDARTQKIIAEWKADFLEDALDLHLATKRVFAPLVLQWARIDDVKAHFIDHPSRTEIVFDRLLADVNAVCKLERGRNSK